ncbi:hypothetical protein [Aquitalea denitrificans]|uniref:hypothetical protein n=1 Tax=Aquitalea denitrificans TaxID=519081 RepID=UPI00135BDD86|nr:hypothetical protein [Aquitalea denitrificans]
MKTTIKAKAILLAALMLTTYSASAADVTAPTPVVGETYDYHKVDLFTGIEAQQWTLTFQGMKNGNYVFSGVNGTNKYSVYKNKNLNNFEVDKKTGETNEAQVLKWPLTIGDSYSYQFKNRIVKVNVEGLEKVETPAGIFDAYHIKLNGMWHDNEGYSGPWYEIYWYAPSVGNFVKIEYSAADMLGRHLQWTKTELVKYSRRLPSTEPTPAN